MNRSLHEVGFALVDSTHPQRKHTLLPESDPKAIEVTDDHFAHAIQPVVRPFDNIDAILKSRIKFVNVIGVNIQIDFASPLRARLTFAIEHHLTLSKRHDRKTESLACFIAVSRNDTE